MVHVVAYNASSTLASVLDRIPKELRARLSEICVYDDASTDETYLVGKGYQQVQDMPQLHVFRNPKNRGYGGNQKLGYRYAIDNGFDIVVLLHGDGQYAPEAMADLLQPIIDGQADAVFGSRMMEQGAARRGGMPLYKFVGNKILTHFENAFLGMDLSEFHSGYRVYSTAALKRIPFEDNSDDFHFDTQIIIQLKAGGFRIKEVPIPTYYGDEISRVNGMKYAWDVSKSVIEYRLHQAGVVHRPEYGHVAPAPYSEKVSPFSRPPEDRRVGPRGLVGAGRRVRGRLPGREAHPQGLHRRRASGEQSTRTRATRLACSRFYVADLDGDAWSPTERDFDRILFADVLEHLRSFSSILSRSRQWLKPGGQDRGLDREHRAVVHAPRAPHGEVPVRAARDPRPRRARPALHPHDLPRARPGRGIPV